MAPDLAARSDEDLMARAAGGNREAFAAIYARHHAAVYRFARLMTGSTAAAEDVVQDVFLALIADCSRYDARRATLSTYLYGIARHHTRRRLARERRFVALDTPAALERAASSADPLWSVAQGEDLLRLRRAILTLPSRYREALVLCDLQDRSYADAAQIGQCAVGTVRSRLHRARQMLAEKMRRVTDRPAVPARPPVRCLA
jgi:RNA polymerase sigma-70 factor (ECF subfamily)